MKTFFNRAFYILNAYIVYALLYETCRLIFLVTYANNEVWNETTSLFKAFLVGLLFDTKIISLLLLPILFFALVETFLNQKNKNWNKLYAITNTVFLLLSALILTIDFYYYSFFQTHIDILVFGLINDDTKEVLASVWTDFPIVRIFLLLILIGFGAYKLFSCLFKIDVTRKIRLTTTRFVSFVLIFAFGYFFGLRGSLTTFPLEVDDSTVSKNPFVNQLTLNGIFTLNEARILYKKNNIAQDPHQYLEEKKLDLQQLVANFLQIDKSEVDAENPLQQLYSTTPANTFLEENPPHVIVILMESMGTVYFTKHDEKLNLLGSLADVLDGCYVFENFMPVGNGTISTLEGLITQTPIGSVAQSAYYNTPFSTATALPFLQKGYQTSFVTGSKLGWRNINNYIPAQGFQTIEGRELILDLNPNAQASGWGVFDEYLFDRIYEKLKNTNNPQYIFGMTTTNHTPYEIPKHYKPLPIAIDDSLRSLIRPTVNIEKTRKNFETFQYSCDALGKFIKKIQECPLGENTIIIATGDHNCRQSFDFDESQMYWTYSVPMIAYIPQKYRMYDTLNYKQWACHNDIFPTLYELALSEATYIKLGRNLLNDTIIPYAINDKFRVFSNDGACYVSNSMHFDWNTSNYLIPTEKAISNDLFTVRQSAQALQYLKNYLEYVNISLKNADH
ncbi:MAG: LTA synthase family protein [Lentimicrobiaceae bacterium]|jgi:phosphoglycerol transferase MdoB-like AlkP superfamily enzyme|nr:LTA synthase family protein [Lentimicrobiaceae bacterium]